MGTLTFIFVLKRQWWSAKLLIDLKLDFELLVATQDIWGHHLGFRKALLSLIIISCSPTSFVLECTYTEVVVGRISSQVAKTQKKNSVAHSCVRWPQTRHSSIDSNDWGLEVGHPEERWGQTPEGVVQSECGVFYSLSFHRRESLDTSVCSIVKL